MRIPSDNRWTQTNQGDVFGVLNDTKNITVNHAGQVQLSGKSFAHFSSATDADFGDTVAILYFNSNYILITDDEAFEYNNAALSFSQIAGTPTLSADGDALVFNEKMYVMGATQLAHWNGSSWTTSVLASALGTNEHPMEVFDSNPTYKLAIADGNKVYTYDTSHNINSNVLTLPSQFSVTTMRYRNGYMYIGTKNTSGGEARVFIWNGDGTNAQYEVPVGGEQVFSMTPYRSTVAFVVDTGEVALVNGSSKETLAGFPIFYTPDKMWGSSVTRRVANRGMMAVRDSIYINADGSTLNGNVENMHSGLWEYNPDSGLTHKAGLSTDEFVIDASLSLASSTLTTSADHNLITGDSVMFSSVSTLVGVDADVVYYVYVTDTDGIKLALSRKSLLAGNYLTITGSASGLDKLVYTPNTDYGKDAITRAGAIGRVITQEALQENWDTDVFFAGRTDNQSGTTTYVLCGLADSFNVGHFTTQRVPSDNISQVWKATYTFIDGIDSAEEKFISKYRTEKEQSKPTMQLSGVWGSATEIHSTSIEFDEDDWNLLEKGDEVTLTSGHGQGKTAHITKVTQTSNTFVVELDESYGSTGVSVVFRADNYKKSSVGVYTRKERDYIKDAITPEAKGAWVQLKQEMRGFQPKVTHLELINSVDKSAM